MAAAFKLTAPIPLESDECAWLLEWAAVTRHQGRRVSDLLVMIPNGAVLAGDAKHRAMQMARMKRQGFKDGVFDYFLPVGSCGYPGLWLEMKRSRRGIISSEQSEFQQLMQSLGWATSICAGWEAAARAITRYLQP